MTEDIEYIYQLFYKSEVKIKGKKQYQKKITLTIHHFMTKVETKFSDMTGRIVSSVVKWRPW